MIDIGLSKIALIGVVALVVIGPEKLPRVARMAGTLYGRAQRYISQVKAEVGREIELEELRKIHNDAREAASSIEQGIAQGLSQTGRDLHSAWNGDAYEDAALEPLQVPLPSHANLALKAKNFRRKKMLRSSAIPSWYKYQTSHKTRVISAAARVARFRPSPGTKTPPFFY
jgi:sec-independent protein translocase protein TatB